MQVWYFGFKWFGNLNFFFLFFLSCHSIAQPQRANIEMWTLTSGEINRQMLFCFFFFCCPPEPMWNSQAYSFVWLMTICWFCIDAQIESWGENKKSIGNFSLNYFILPAIRSQCTTMRIDRWIHVIKTPPRQLRFSSNENVTCNVKRFRSHIFHASNRAMQLCQLCDDKWEKIMHK